MNGKEFAGRITDAVFGKRVEGTIAAVLPDVISPDKIRFSRYVVEDHKNNLVDILIPKGTIINTGMHPAMSVQNSDLSIGQEISLRTAKVKPWINGQIV